VRFFHADSIGNIEACIVKHYKQMEIVSDNRTSFTLLPPWVILSETTVKQSASDASPLLGGQLLRSILTGERYPITLFHAMLTRIRAGNIVSQTKAAVIKAILLRNFTTNTNESEVITMSLNTESDNKPYVLGRLFAVLEKLQRDAAGGALNATIRDRYFANACANPGIVFPTLLRLSMHHSAKLDRPGFYERLKTELLGKLEVEKPFPAALSLEDQGRLIVGYYHQTQDLYTSKKPENKELNEAENAKETNDREEQ
jgi:CRISPR-associated protein Csd1